MKNSKETIREFKRHYHRVRKIRSQLANGGKIQMSIRGDAESNRCTATTNIPNEELLTRFGLNMRRFLNSSSDLFLKSVWERFGEESGIHISAEERNDFEKGYSDFEAGSLKLEFNGRTVSAKEVYDFMGDGQVFGGDEKAAEALKSFFRTPFMSEWFRFQFFAYTITGFEIASYMFSRIRKLEGAGAITLSVPLANPQCICCLSTSGSFRSVEHVLPEALGGHEAVLEAGMVCDACNNGVFSQLDSSFVDFGPVNFLRVLNLPFTKSGDYPQADFQNLSVKKTGPRRIDFTAKDGSAEPRNQKDLGNGWISWTQHFRGNILDHITLGRSLFKIGLGFVAMEQGHEHALSSRFDSARAFIKGESLFPNWLLLKTSIEPHSQIHMEFLDLSPGTVFWLDVFGAIFVFNLEPEPSFKAGEELGQIHFTALDLSTREPQGMGN